MSMSKEDVLEAVRKMRELKYELNTVQAQLAEETFNFKGTVREALEIGLIRLNFSAPSGFRRYLERQRNR